MLNFLFSPFRVFFTIKNAEEHNLLPFISNNADDKSKNNRFLDHMNNVSSITRWTSFSFLHRQKLTEKKKNFRTFVTPPISGTFPSRLCTDPTQLPKMTSQCLIIFWPLTDIYDSCGFGGFCRSSARFNAPRISRPVSQRV